MRRYWLVFILSCPFYFLHSYVPCEYLFSDFLVKHQKRLDGSRSRVLLVDDFAQFDREVVHSSLPVVVKVVASGESLLARAAYQEVADLFVGRVVFVLANMKDVADVVRMIMSRLRIRQVALPVLMFFSSGAFLPPLLSGTVDRGRLIEVINSLFFSGRASLSFDLFRRWLCGVKSVARGMREYERSRRRRLGGSCE
jgi:hypothetical protein